MAIPLFRCGVLSLIVLISPFARADLSPLLDKVVAAYGGGSTPTALLERGSTTSLRRGIGAVERLWAKGSAAGDRFRIVIAYQGGDEKRAMLGAQAWQQDRPASAMFRGAIVLQAARMALPWRLRDARASLVDRGATKAADGRNRQLVEWPIEPGLTLTAEIDPQSGHILRSVGRIDTPGTVMEFATEYSDFVARPKLAYAAREKHFAMGQNIGETVLTEVSVPERIDDSMFRPSLDEPATRPAGPPSTPH